MHLLVVEDEPALLEVFRDQLEHLGHTSIACPSGAEAVGILRSDQAFDALWTDLEMPGVDGFEVLRQARVCRPGTPAMIVSGHGDRQHVLEALRAGALNFLLKPFRPQELEDALGRIGEVIERRRKELGAWRTMESSRLEFHIPARISIASALGKLLRQHFRGMVSEAEAQGIHVAINELLYNAVEHGALGITQREKADALAAGEWRDLLRSREEAEDSAQKRVRVVMEAVRGRAIRITIEDRGDGFDHAMLPDPSEPENLLLPSGRGIFLARLHLSELRFEDGGRRAIASFDLSHRQSAEA